MQGDAEPHTHGPVCIDPNSRPLSPWANGSGLGIRASFWRVGKPPPPPDVFTRPIKLEYNCFLKKLL